MSDINNVMPSGPGPGRKKQTAEEKRAALNELKKFQILMELPGGIKEVADVLNVHTPILQGILDNTTPTTSNQTTSTSGSSKSTIGSVNIDELNNLDLDEDQVNLLTRLLNNIPSEKDAKFLEGKDKNKTISMIDEKAGEFMKSTAEGLEKIIKVASVMDPALLDKFASGINKLFSTFENIPEQAFKNLGAINKVIFTTALGLTAMAASLFVISTIPASDALVGLGVISATVGALALLGIPLIAGLVTTGAIALGVIGVGVLAFAAPFSLGLKLLEGAEGGVEVFDVYVGALKNLASVNFANLLFGTLAMSYLPIVITASAFALGLMPEAGTDNFANYVNTLKELASIDDLGGKLMSASVGIAALTGAMLLSGAGDLIGSIMQLGTDVVKGIGGLFGFETDHNPFQPYIDLANAGDIGPNLQAAAKGIISIRAAMFGSGLGDFLNTITGLGTEALKAIGGLFGLSTDASPFKTYIELAPYGPDLKAAGEGISALAIGFKSLEDFDNARVQRAAQGIKDFIKTIGLDNLSALGSAFAAFNNPMFGGEANTSAAVLNNVETVNDAIIRKDGSIIQLNPNDNVYATINDIGGTSTSFPSFEGSPGGGDVSGLSDDLKRTNDVIVEMKSSLDALVNYLKEKGMGEVISNTVVQQKGYSDSVLRPTLVRI